MHARQFFTIVIALIALTSSFGCRSSRSIRDTVRVTEHPGGEGPDFEAPKQRLATSKTRDPDFEVSVTTSPPKDDSPHTRRIAAKEPTNNDSPEQKLASDSQRTKIERLPTGSEPVEMSLADRVTSSVENARKKQAAELALSAKREEIARQNALAKQEAIAKLKAAARAAQESQQPSASQLAATSASSNPSHASDDEAVAREREAQEILSAFEKSPPEVQKQARRMVLAALARSADKTQQPKSVEDYLTQMLDNPPELPEPTMRKATTPPNRLAANKTASSEATTDPAPRRSRRSADTVATMELPKTDASMQTDVSATEPAIAAKPAAEDIAQNPAATAAVTDDASTVVQSVGFDMPESKTIAQTSSSQASTQNNIAQAEAELPQAADIAAKPAPAAAKTSVATTSAAPTATSTSAAPIKTNETPSPAQNVQPASAETAVTKLSDQQLYDALVKRLNKPTEGETEADRSRRLIMARHLMVMAGNPDRAVDKLEGLSDKEQEYLRHQLLGLWTLIDPQGHPVPGRRFSAALPQLREANKYLAAATDSLEISKIAFCTEIESYGQIKQFKGNRFKSGQQVILYCEIENFTVDEVENGFKTHLQGSYDVFDSENNKVVSQLLPADEQVSANYLRDYFIAYQMHLPQELDKGTYRLQLTMEDVSGKKYGQASIPFEISK